MGHYSNGMGIGTQFIGYSDKNIAMATLLIDQQPFEWDKFYLCVPFAREPQIFTVNESKRRNFNCIAKNVLDQYAP